MSCLVLIYTGVAVIQSRAQAVDVQVNLNRGHVVGGVSAFDRSKFITIHSSHTEGDWDHGVRGANNFTNDLLADFAIGRDVYFGRDTGGVSWHRRGNTNIDEDSLGSGWVDAADMASQGSYYRNQYNGDTDIHPYESRAQTDIMCAQYNGFWPNGNVYNGWAISTANTPTEPFGSATGDFMGLYLNHFYDNFGAQVGRPSPAYVEIINEPDWHILDETSHPDYGSVSASKIWEFHNGVADGIRAHNTNSLIGGFCTTFPDHDEGNFAEWNDEWKSFIDIAGAKMDFWALHLYDFPAMWNNTRYRKGANLEATFDMIDYYSEAVLGQARPYVISEYGAQTHEYSGDDWSAYRDWLKLKSINSMVMTFMDRPHLMLKTIPFTVVKAEWGRNQTTQVPYGSRLMRQEDEPASYTGEWVYTELVRFYDLWSDVNGDRVEISSSDPDIQVDAYADGNKVYVILNNTVDQTQTIDLSFVENYGNTVQSVYGKHLYWTGPSTTGSVMLDETNHVGLLSQVVIESEAAMVLEYTMASAVNIDAALTESKHFATSYLQTIQGGVPCSFQIPNVSTAASGKAVLRLSIARAHASSKQPTVLINDTALTVPSDVMGRESDGRFQFFGTLLIPVPINLLQFNNDVDITFPDSGGHISTVALQVYNYSGGGSPTVPSTPSGLTATVVNSSRIDLSWTDNSDNETNFDIERKIGSSGTWTYLNSVSANVTSYSDMGLTPATTYYYRISARNAAGNSDYSNESSAATDEAGWASEITEVFSNFTGPGGDWISFWHAWHYPDGSRNDNEYTAVNYNSGFRWGGHCDDLTYSSETWASIQYNPTSDALVYTWRAMKDGTYCYTVFSDNGDNQPTTWLKTLTEVDIAVQNSTQPVDLRLLVREYDGDWLLSSVAVDNVPAGQTNVFTIDIRDLTWTDVPSAVEAEMNELDEGPPYGGPGSAKGGPSATPDFAGLSGGGIMIDNVQTQESGNLHLTSITWKGLSCGDPGVRELQTDYTNDCYVNKDDLDVLAIGWISVYDLSDFEALASEWLDCTEPADINCNPF